MQTVTTLYNASIDAKKRSIQAILDLYTGSTLTDSFQSDRIVNIEIQRTGEQSKFFGFGVSHKANIRLLDKNRELNITKDNYFKLQLGVDVLGEAEYKTFPKFYVSEVTRDEKTNELSITAYDILNNATAHTVSELDIAAPYTLKEYADVAVTFLDKGERNLPDNILYLKSQEYANAVTVDEDDLIHVNFEVEKDMISGKAFFTEGDVTLKANQKYLIYANILSGSYTGGFKISIVDTDSTYLTNFWMGTTSGSTTVVSDHDRTIKHLQIVNSESKGVKFNNAVMELKIQPIPDATPIFTDEEAISALSLSYEEGANFDGAETLREALNAIAEATQTIYYVGGNDYIHFKRLNTTLDKTISKDIYIELTSGANKTLQTICSATELGDNVSDSTETAGETQYVRDNPFWELRDDIATVVETALNEVGDMAINEFSCQWRGDPALEPGDRIAYVTKDDAVGYSYLINDTLIYNGGLQQTTDWSFTKSDATASNPTSLGEVLKQTYAKVDKQNKEIQLVASEASANTQELAALKVNTESISASVSKMEEANTDAIASINGDIVTLTKKVEATMTSEDVKLEIKSELSNGVDKVTTATGFTFNEEGLTIAKTGSEMKTNIDEDGMSVYRDNQEVLTADNQGVIAYNLKAKTYLIVGENSRFEDFTSTSGEARTGCFWIGG